MPVAMVKARTVPNDLAGAGAVPEDPALMQSPKRRVMVVQGCHQPFLVRSSGIAEVVVVVKTGLAGPQARAGLELAATGRWGLVQWVNRARPTLARVVVVVVAHMA
jgi:hypothetical protein